MAAPQVISAMAAQLLSLSAKIGRSSAGSKIVRMSMPAQVGTPPARSTRPLVGSIGPATAMPTPSRVSIEKPGIA